MPWSRSASSASWSGRTTCTRWACRSTPRPISSSPPWSSRCPPASRCSAGSRRCGAARSSSRRRCCGRSASSSCSPSAASPAWCWPMPASMSCCRTPITWWRTSITCCRWARCSRSSRASISGSRRFTGYMYNETLGKLHFWITFIGVNLAFFPMHFLGLAGMPRRYADYPDAFAGWNYVSSIGAFIAGFGVLIFLAMLAEAFAKKRKAGDNPWGVGATTLEWTLPSPPPFHQFNELPHDQVSHVACRRYPWPDPRVTTVGDFFALLKPRVMSLVVFTGLAGIVAAPGHVHPLTAFTALLCIAVAAGASGCLNMAYDSDIDRLMTRTATRPIPHGPCRAGGCAGLRLGAVGGVGGHHVAVRELRWRRALLAFTVFFYVVVYTLWLKRRTPQNIVIGGLAGRAAAGHRLGCGDRHRCRWRRCCWWRSSSCGRRRISGRCRCGARDDYARAGVPMLPVVKGKPHTRLPDPALYAGAGAAGRGCRPLSASAACSIWRRRPASASGSCGKPSPPIARRDEVQGAGGPAPVRRLAALSVRAVRRPDRREAGSAFRRSRRSGS